MLLHQFIIHRQVSNKDSLVYNCKWTINYMLTNIWNKNIEGFHGNNIDFNMFDIVWQQYKKPKEIFSRTLYCTWIIFSVSTHELWSIQRAITILNTSGVNMNNIHRLHPNENTFMQIRAQIDRTTNKSYLLKLLNCILRSYK